MGERFRSRRPSNGTVLGILAIVLVIVGGGTAFGALTQAANGARRVDFAGTATDAAPGSNAPGAHRILKLDELTIKVSCIDAGAGAGRVYVTFSSTGTANLSWEDIRFDNPGTNPEVNGTGFAPSGGSYAVADLTGINHFENGQFIYRNGSRTITVSLLILVNGSGYGKQSCLVQGTAVPAPS